jgi:hypothetical protein
MEKAWMDSTIGEHDSTPTTTRKVPRTIAESEMTDEDIIKLAIEHTISGLKFDEKGLLRFANLVAAAESEACAGLAERRMLIDKSKDRRIGHHHACKEIATDIRARVQA